MAMAWIQRRQVVTTLLLCLMCINIYAEDYVYYASLGPSEDRQGLYGGPLDVSDNGTASNLTKTGVYCANMRSAGFYTGFDIRSMGYDPITNQAIVQMEVLSYTRTSAFTTKVCNSQSPKCKTADINVIFAQADTREKSKGNIGPFAMWNNSIYFLADRYERAPHRMIRHKIELRKLDGCEDRYPFTMTNAFDIDSCSVFLATFAEEVGQDIGFEMEDTLLVGRHLKIISKNGRLVFISQIQNQTFNDVYDVDKFTMLLVAVGDSVPSTTLYEEPLPDDFAEHEIAQLGGIDFRDNLLCWSMLDRILCADWDGEGSLKNIRKVVQSGMASKICMVEDNVDYNNVTTGVAIKDTSNGITLFFGCYAGETNQGGAGVAHLSRDGKSRRILPLTEKGNKIYAGSLFFGCGSRTSSAKNLQGLHSLIIGPLIFTMLLKFQQ